jgi:hypothetical protein
MNTFPIIGINTGSLLRKVEKAIEEARIKDGSKEWGVNWGDIGVADIEYRLSMLDSSEPSPYCVVVLEEASPHSELARHVYEIIKEEFPNTYVECEW